MSANAKAGGNPDNLRDLIFKVTYHKAGQAKTELPGLIDEVLNRRLWEQYSDRDGQPFNNMIEWLTATHPPGCGMKWDTSDSLGSVSIAELMEFYTKSRPELQEAISAELKKAKPKHGGDRSKELRSSLKTGRAATHRASTLQLRLQTEKPQVWADYCAGRYDSITAAAIAAGIMTGATNLQRAQSAWRKMTAPERRKFLKWVESS